MVPRLGELIIVKKVEKSKKEIKRKKIKKIIKCKKGYIRRQKKILESNLVRGI